MKRISMDYSASSWALLGLARFFLALIVFTTHLHWVTTMTFPFPQIYLLGGQAAVFGFFLISGISIAHSYGERPNGYFARRFLRVYPLYFVAICFSQSLVYILGSPVVLADWSIAAAGFKTALANLFMLQGFVAIPITYDMPVWSLSFEIGYYLLTPLFFKSKTYVLLAIVAISMCIFPFPNNYLFGYRALKYAWPWLLGFLLVREKGSPLVLGFCALGCVLVYLKQNELAESLRVITFGTVLLLTVVASKVRLGPIMRGLFDYLGELSYPLYLFHAPLCILLYAKVGIRNCTAFVILVLLATALIDGVFDKKLKAIFWKPVVSYLVKRAKALRESPSENMAS